MTAEEVRDQAMAIWPLPWEIEYEVEPPVISASVGGFSVVISLSETGPMTIFGTLLDREFYDVETNDVPHALTELEREFRRLVDVPALSGR
jgi:hypothetical protein